MTMSESSNPVIASCRCGQVRFAVSGAPIMHVACYCTSCRTAGRGFEQTPDSPPVVTDDGGTDLVLYRKDRFVQTTGAGLLSEHRLKARLADPADGRDMLQHPRAAGLHQAGHWVSVYRACLAGDLRAADARSATQEKPVGVTLPEDAPNHATRPGAFMWKLLSSWAAMGFRRPAVTW